MSVAKTEKKERKANRRAAKIALQKAIVRNAREQGILSLSKRGAAKKLLDRLLKAQLLKMKTATPEEMESASHE
jgi:hypothetical protein